MIVQVIGLVQMGGNHYLIFFTPQLFGQLQPDLMGSLWVSFSGGKALIAVIGYRAVLLAEPLFDSDHLVAGSRGAAIHPGHKPLHDGGSFVIGCDFFRLLLLDGVFDDIREALGVAPFHISFFIDGGVLGLVRVLYIDDHLSQPAAHPPDGCCGHSFTPSVWAESQLW